MKHNTILKLLSEGNKGLFFYYSEIPFKYPFCKNAVNVEIYGTSKPVIIFDFIDEDAIRKLKEEILPKYKEEVIFETNGIYYKEKEEVNPWILIDDNLYVIGGFKAGKKEKDEKFISSIPYRYIYSVPYSSVYKKQHIQKEFIEFVKRFPNTVIIKSKGIGKKEIIKRLIGVEVPEGLDFESEEYKLFFNLNIQEDEKDFFKWLYFAKEI